MQFLRSHLRPIVSESLPGNCYIIIKFWKELILQLTQRPRGMTGCRNWKQWLAGRSSYVVSLTCFIFLLGGFFFFFKSTVVLACFRFRPFSVQNSCENNVCRTVTIVHSPLLICLSLTCLFLICSPDVALPDEQPHSSSQCAPLHCLSKPPYP